MTQRGRAAGAASTRVANELGAGNERAAAFAAWISMLCGTMQVQLYRLAHETMSCTAFDVSNQLVQMSAAAIAIACQHISIVLAENPLISMSSLRFASHSVRCDVV